MPRTVASDPTKKPRSIKGASGPIAGSGDHVAPSPLTKKQLHANKKSHKKA